MFAGDFIHYILRNVPPDRFTQRRRVGKRVTQQRCGDIAQCKNLFGSAISEN
jgi:hypothetical protein